jgi:hypothetical protein
LVRAKQWTILAAFILPGDGSVLVCNQSGIVPAPFISTALVPISGHLVDHWNRKFGVTFGESKATSWRESVGMFPTDFFAATARSNREIQKSEPNPICV